MLNVMQMALLAASPGIPVGAIGLWYMSQYTSGTGNGSGKVPNSVASTSTNASLSFGPGRIFSHGEFWTKENCSIANSVSLVDDLTTGPDGTSRASTLTVSGGSTWRLYQNVSVAAGTYTVGCWVKLISGSGAFKIGQAFTPSWTSQTATGTWTRFSAVCSYNGIDFPGFGIGTDATASAGVFAICDLNVFAGSSDLGAETAAGHLDLFKSGGSMSLSSGLLSVSGGAVGLMQWPTSSAFSAGHITVVAVQKAASGFNNQFATNGFLGFISGYEDDSIFVGSAVGSNGTPGIALGAVGGGSNSVLGFPQLMPFMLDAEGDPLAVLAHSWDGTTCKTYVNGKLVLSNAPGAVTPPTYSQLYFSRLAHSSHPNYSTFSSMALWNRALSDADVAAASTVLAGTSATSGNPVPNAKWLFVLGDQIAARKFGYLAARDVTNKVKGANFGYSNASVNDASFASYISQIVSFKASVGPQKVVALVNIGRNDIGTGNAATIASTLSGKLDTLRAGGVKVVACTLIDSEYDANQTQFDTDRAALNTSISGWSGTHADAIANLAGVTHLGANGDHLNATYFTGGVTPTDTGDALLSPVAVTAIDSL